MAQSLSETFLTGLQCLRCGQFFLPNSIEYVCPCRPNLGSDLGHLDAVYDYEAVAAMRIGHSGPEKSGAMAPSASDTANSQSPPSQSSVRTLERWWPLLPVRPESLPPLPVGDTPLLPAHRLADAMGLTHLYIKDDGRNPSGSFKDRASAIAVARARETGREVSPRQARATPRPRWPLWVRRPPTLLLFSFPVRRLRPRSPNSWSMAAKFWQSTARTTTPSIFACAPARNSAGTIEIQALTHI